MKIINDCYIIEPGDPIEIIRYLLNLNCNVYIYLEYYGHMYRLVYKNLDYITIDLQWVLSKAKIYRYDDKQLLNMIKAAGSLFINEDN